MRFAVFGLAVSSSWGNGHATLWRGLWRALAGAGHRITFFERDQPWYAAARDCTALPGGELVIYPDWDSVTTLARSALAQADVAIVTSYCADALAARDLLFDVPGLLRVFYDLDTPVTLSALDRGEAVPWLDGAGLRDYDLVLSYTGGPSLDRLRHELGARRTAPLYGHVDPDLHRPARPDPAFTADLSWLGTWAADRQAGLEALLVQPALCRREARFLIAGAQYPQDFPWGPNVRFIDHLDPARHAAFFASSRLTLNITRQAMAHNGWCPPGRLFEAGACGAAMLSDWWPGLDEFYEPGTELLVGRDLHDSLAALDRSPGELACIGQAARARTLDCHTSAHRARELLALVESSAPPGCDAARPREAARRAGAQPVRAACGD